MSNTIWPFRPAYKDAVEVTDKIHNEFAIVDNTCINLDTNELLVNIWLDAFAHLPPPLTSEPIFRTTCLNMHWDCESTQSSHPSREQGALLLDILTLALIPPRSISESNISLLRSRCDLQPLWFRFMFSTLSLWGLYTPHFVRAFVTHVCSNLFALVDGVAHGHGHQSDSNNPPWKATSGGKSEDYSSHPNYMLSCLACLQGIYHALLLPGGTAASVFRTRKHLSLVHDRSLGVTASSLTGLPEIISNATEFSELVSSIRCQTDSDSILFTIESSSGVPPCFNSPWNEPDFRLYESTSSNPAVHPAPAEPSVVLTPKPSIVFGNSKHDAQNFAAIFTTRTKRLFDSNGSSDAHPLLQAQTELFRLLPTVLCSLAELWDAFNQSPMGFVHPSDTVSSKDVWPSSRSVSIEQLPFLTALGTSALARPALRMLLQPIALLHPAPFLISMALSWPANLYDENESALPFSRAGTPKEHSVMSLLTPYLSPASGNKGKHPYSPSAGIFHVFINRFTITDDKREQRELQELCHRLLESAATIAASALKQPTWFRRTLQVQRNDNTSDEGARTIPTFASSSTFAQPRCEDDQADATFTPPLGRSTCPRSHSAVVLNSEITTARLSPPRPLAETNCEAMDSCGLSRTILQNDMAVQAINLLTEHMVNFLDVIYRSDEKDRIPTFLTNILVNIFPYLRVRMLLLLLIESLLLLFIFVRL
ncbi:unnamed protein product [Dicrocoelium dendriticum]|nr:unnamed protein product [Dicrocoelium dendriticum]